MLNVELRQGSPSGDPPSILVKAFDLLQAFNSSERVMTLSELSRASGLSKSTVHRLLARLVDLGAIERHRNAYKLGLGLLKLGATTPAGGMRDIAMPYLAGLHRWTGQTVHFAVLRQFDVVYLEKLSPPQAPAITLTGVGSRLPANCTAIGKALLAYEDFDDLAHFLPSPMPGLTSSSIQKVEQLLTQLRVVRETGLAREQDEAQPGLACAAAAVVVDGFAVGAVSVGFRAGTDMGAKLDGALRHTAAQIANDVRAGLVDRPHLHPHEF